MAIPYVSSLQMFDRTLQEKYILKNTDKLITHGLAHSPDSNYSTLSPTPLGKLMSSHCVRFDTMVAILQLQPHASMHDLIKIVAKSAELSNIR